MNRFDRDEDGAAFVVFAIFAVVFVALIGGAVDYAVALSLRQKLASAADSSALAVAVDRITNQQQARKRIQAYLSEHLPKSKLYQKVRISRLHIQGDEVEVVLKAQSSNAFLTVIGMPRFDVEVRAVALTRRNKAELALVLDNTGSMRVPESKIEALRTAATNLTNILIDDTSRFGADVRIALVPFANAVNIGTHNRNATWFASEQIGTRDWNGCVLARPAPDDVRDTRHPSWSPYAEWGCPQPILPLTASKPDIIAAITNMQADGNTIIPQGLVWGWRVLSQNHPFNTGSAYSDTGSRKYIILMTDGFNDVGYGKDANGERVSKVTVPSAYGTKERHQLGANPKRDLDNKTLQICRNIHKVTEPDENSVAIVTITFGNVPTETQELMSACASPPSACPLAKCTYHAPTEEQLNQAFTDIASAIKRVRLSR